MSLSFKTVQNWLGSVSDDKSRNTRPIPFRQDTYKPGKKSIVSI